MLAIAQVEVVAVDQAAALVEVQVADPEGVLVVDRVEVPSVPTAEIPAEDRVIAALNNLGYS